MHYILYKTTNTITNQYYIGVHQTNNLDDGYLGSGKRLRNSVAKYGKEHFDKQILEVFVTAEEMYKREIEVVTEEFCRQYDVLNIVPGGTGGSILTNRKAFEGPHSDETKELLRQQSSARKHTDEARRKISENNFARRYPDAQREHARKIAPKGPRSEETKRKISNTLKGHTYNVGRRGPDSCYEKVVCPHCNKEGPNNAMKRWHFDNCKNRSDEGK